MFLTLEDTPVENTVFGLELIFKKAEDFAYILEGTLDKFLRTA